MTPIPQDVLNVTAQRLSYFAAEWSRDTPSQVHDGSLDAGGAPQLHPDFMRWLTAPAGQQPRNPDGRLRLTRAMRMLRREGPREFDVVYRIMVAGSSIQETTDWLNDRAIKGGHPERYSLKDTTMILIAGIDKVAHWY